MAINDKLGAYLPSLLILCTFGLILRLPSTLTFMIRFGCEHIILNGK